jgi:hypothetical protein
VPLGMPTPTDLGATLGAVDGVLKTSWSELLGRLFNRLKLASTRAPVYLD